MHKEKGERNHETRIKKGDLKEGKLLFLYLAARAWKQSEKQREGNDGQGKGTGENQKSRSPGII